MKHNNFVEQLNIIDGIITYNDFDIDESIPFDDQWYMYKEDILQVSFGKRFILNVGWLPESDPEGSFNVYAVLDNDWTNPISIIRVKTLSELKKAIERTVVFISEIKKIKDIPYRDVTYENFD